ncbi:hypothetical protein EJB05_35333, partial [Eragrostis curvula]
MGGLVFIYVRGAQIQSTMFNEAAKKFYTIFEMGKICWCSSKRIAHIECLEEMVLLDSGLRRHRQSLLWLFGCCAMRPSLHGCLILQMLLKMRHDQEVAAFRTAARLFPGL